MVEAGGFRSWNGWNLWRCVGIWRYRNGQKGGIRENGEMRGGHGKREKKKGRRKVKRWHREGGDHDGGDVFEVEKRKGGWNSCLLKAGG